jgi:hypothetical protein
MQLSAPPCFLHLLGRYHPLLRMFHIFKSEHMFLKQQRDFAVRLKNQLMTAAAEDRGEGEGTNKHEQT